MRYTEKIQKADLFIFGYWKNNKKILDGYNELVYTNHCKEVR